MENWSELQKNLFEQLLVLPGNLSNHLLITMLPLFIGICVSLPLAIFVIRFPSLQYPVLTVVSVIQTIPSLALLALMVPVLLGVSMLTMTLFGFEISALGFYPTVIALTLYSILPMLRNAVTGLMGVDPAMIEAARGSGMTPRQVLTKVQLPLAAPVIIAGIRTATVWVVGIATLATPVGQQCLGNYIFRGLQTRNWTAVLFGCIIAAILAMILDLLIGGLQKAVSERRRTLAIVVTTCLIFILLTGLISPQIVLWAKQSAENDRGVIWIGSKTFTEQYILSSVMQELLNDAGFDARQKESLGSTVVFDALAGGEIDCYVDYSGTIWANYMKHDEFKDSQTVIEEVSEWLNEEHGIHCMGSLGFENAYALAMEEEEAQAKNINDINDLTPYSSDMVIGGDYEFFGRPEWRTVRISYDLDFKNQKSYDSTFMYNAIRQDEVDVIASFSSDGRIEAFDLTILDDPKNAIPPYDALLLLSQSAAKKQGVIEALKPMIYSIEVETMRHANYLVDRDEGKQTIKQAARWLKDQIKQKIPE